MVWPGSALSVLVQVPAEGWRAFVCDAFFRLQQRAWAQDREARSFWRRFARRCLGPETTLAAASDEAVLAEPRNPRHFDDIERGRNSTSLFRDNQ